MNTEPNSHCHGRPTSNSTPIRIHPYSSSIPKGFRRSKAGNGNSSTPHSLPLPLPPPPPHRHIPHIHQRPRPSHRPLHRPAITSRCRRPTQWHHRTHLVTATLTSNIAVDSWHQRIDLLPLEAETSFKGDLGHMLLSILMSIARRWCRSPVHRPMIRTHYLSRHIVI